MQPKPFSCHVRDIREKKKTKRSTDDHKQRGANHLGAPTQEAAPTPVACWRCENCTLSINRRAPGSGVEYRNGIAIVDRMFEGPCFTRRDVWRQTDDSTCGNANRHC